MNKIKILMVEPKKSPYLADIGDDLKSMQEVVGGYIETVTLSDTAVIICNEEGKRLRLEANRKLVGDILVGTFFVAGYRGEEFASLPGADIEKYAKQFKI